MFWKVEPTACREWKPRAKLIRGKASAKQVGTEFDLSHPAFSNGAQCSWKKSSNDVPVGLVKNVNF